MHDRRLHLSVLRVSPRRRRSWSSGSAIRTTPPPPSKEAKALMAAAGYRERHQGARLPGPRRRQLQALVAGDPGDAAADAEHRPAICATWWNRCGSTTSPTATSTWRSAPSCRRCSIRRTTSTPGTRTAGRRTTRPGATPKFDALIAADRPRGRSREAAGADPPGGGDLGAGSAAAAGRVGEDRRRLVQLRQGTTTRRLLRRLRRRAAWTRSGWTSRHKQRIANREAKTQ